MPKKIIIGPQCTKILPRFIEISNKHQEEKRQKHTHAHLKFTCNTPRLLRKLHALKVLIIIPKLAQKEKKKGPNT